MYIAMQQYVKCAENFLNCSTLTPCLKAKLGTHQLRGSISDSSTADSAPCSIQAYLYGSSVHRIIFSKSDIIIRTI